jgi:hypothetical protein
MKCEYCNQRPATHFCDGCQHWVCNNPICLARASAAALKRGAQEIAGMLKRS